MLPFRTWQRRRPKTNFTFFKDTKRGGKVPGAGGVRLDSALCNGETRSLLAGLCAAVIVLLLSRPLSLRVGGWRCFPPLWHPSPDRLAFGFFFVFLGGGRCPPLFLELILLLFGPGGCKSKLGRGTATPWPSPFENQWGFFGQLGSHW